MLSYKKIIDLNYCYSSENINLLSYCGYLPKFGTIEQFFKFFRNMFGHLILGFRPLKLMVLKQQIEQNITVKQLKQKMMGNLLNWPKM